MAEMSKLIRLKVGRGKTWLNFIGHRKDFGLNIIPPPPLVSVFKRSI